MIGYKTALWGLASEPVDRDHRAADYVRIVIRESDELTELFENAEEKGDTFICTELRRIALEAKADAIIVPMDALTPRMLAWFHAGTIKWYDGKMPQRVEVMMQVGMDDVPEVIGMI